MLTKYGYTTIGVVMIIASAMLTAGFLVPNQVIKWIIIIAALALVGVTLNFFRDPERTVPNEQNIIISPADGKVIVIKDVVDTKFIKGDAVQISVFMSPLNVHVNRIPLTGTVKYLKYYQGKFLTAFDDKASDENERSEIGIEFGKTKVLYTQVAGFLARRIVTDLSLEQAVTIGDRFGMIKFGSRVDIIVPKGFETNVKLGDKVTAGETILFRGKIN